MVSKNITAHSGWESNSPKVELKESKEIWYWRKKDPFHFLSKRGMTGCSFNDEMVDIIFFGDGPKQWKVKTLDTLGCDVVLEKVIKQSAITITREYGPQVGIFTMEWESVVHNIMALELLKEVKVKLVKRFKEVKKLAPVLDLLITICCQSMPSHWCKHLKNFLQVVLWQYNQISIVHQRVPNSMWLDSFEIYRPLEYQELKLVLYIFDYYTLDWNKEENTHVIS